MTTSQAHDDYFQRIREVFPEINLENAEVNVDGLVNVAIINDGQVYRFARNDYAVEALRNEVAVLKLVQAHISLQTPQFEIIDSDFVTYPFIAGRPLFRNDILRLDEPGQNRLAEQMATFLNELHTIPEVTLAEHGIQPSGGRKTQAEWLQLYEDAQHELFPLMYRSTRTWVDNHFAPLLTQPDWIEYTPVLIHDDLAPYHVLYDAAANRINGIIDFGTAGLGDPASDYALLINAYGETFLQRMATYDRRIPTLIDRARFYAGTLPLQWVLGGIRSGANGWFTAHLEGARDVQPYGLPLSR